MAMRTFAYTVVYETDAETGAICALVPAMDA